MLTYPRRIVCHFSRLQSLAILLTLVGTWATGAPSIHVGGAPPTKASAPLPPRPAATVAPNTAAFRTSARCVAALGAVADGRKVDSRVFRLPLAERDIAGVDPLPGCCYGPGRGVEKDVAQAITWYRKAAAHGVATANAALARLGQAP